MNLSDLSLEEAIKLGFITRGSWNNDDWGYPLPMWRNALNFAEEKHKECNSTYISKKDEIRSGKIVPYIVFIKKLISFLSGEVHLTDDYILTIAALYNITDKTNCTVAELENLFGKDIADDVIELNKGNNETLSQYITGCMANKNGYMLICVLLSVMLIEEEEVDICPFESWEDDYHIIRI